MFDIICLTIPWLYNEEQESFINQFFKILENKISLDSGKIFFRVRDTALFLTRAYLADGTYTADGEIKAGGERDERNYLS